MATVADVLRLTRIEHSAMLVVAVIAAELVAGGLPPLQTLALSLVTPVFVSMGSFAINDYFDVEVDRLNGKKGPIVSGRVTKRQALYVTAASMLIGVLASALIGAAAFAIAVVFAALALLYSYRLKQTLFWGNAYVALSMVIPFIYGAYVVGSGLSAAILLVSLMVFLSGLAREIHGTIRDYEGDIKVRNVNSIPKAIGKGASAMIALLLYVAAIAVSAYLALYIAPFSRSVPFVVMIAASDLMLAYVGIGCIGGDKRFYGRARNVSLAAMALAILAIIAAEL